MTVTRRRGFGWVVAGLMLIAGCAHRVAPDAPADPGWAYLYGRFVMKTGSREDTTKRPQAVKFILRCQDGSTYQFATTDTPYVQMLRVGPTRCWFVETVASHIRTKSMRRIKIDPTLQRPLDFQSGRAHYLGDFFAVGESDGGSFTSHGRWELFLSPVDDRYESTTAEMKQMYPNLGGLPTVDTRLVPAVERKRTNGVTLAPGEPPLSPDRVAAVAPFIKRNYASSDECEAACPTGQCLPYRSETGSPVIACVTLCNTDKDCPEGLACNCPTSDGGAGAGCRRIASRPRDPMARICLSVEAGGQRR